MSLFDFIYCSIFMIAGLAFIYKGQIPEGLLSILVAETIYGFNKISDEIKDK